MRDALGDSVALPEYAELAPPQPSAAKAGDQRARLEA